MVKRCRIDGAEIRDTRVCRLPDSAAAQGGFLELAPADADPPALLALATKASGLPRLHALEAWVRAGPSVSQAPGGSRVGDRENTGVLAAHFHGRSGRGDSKLRTRRAFFPVVI